MAKKSKDKTMQTTRKKPGRKPDPIDRDVTTIKLSEIEKAAFSEAASLDGFGDRSSWMRAKCVVAARKSFRDAGREDCPL